MTQPYPSAPVADHRPEPVASRNGSNLSERVRSLRLAESAQSSSSRNSVLPWAVCVLCALMTAGFGYRAYRITPATQGAETSTATTAVPTATVAAPSTASSSEVALEVKGNVTPIHQIQISPQVGGEIIMLDPNFKEGAFYNKGIKLAVIDPVIYDAQVKSAEAALHVAETNLQQVETGSMLNDLESARAQLRNLAAKVELSKVDERFNIAAKNGVARLDLERSTAQVALDQAAFNVQKETVGKAEVSLEEQRLVARANVGTAKANLLQAEHQLKNCLIIAPTTGTILTKKAELGGYVNPLAFGAAGYLCEMADLTEQEVEVMVQERDRPNVFVGQKCNVMPQAFQYDETFLKAHPGGYQGVVSRILPNADRSKGAIPVRVKVIFPDDEVELYHKEGKWHGYVIPDMGAVVTFKKKSN